VSSRRHILWGAIVGALTAAAFNAILTFQFDTALTLGFWAAAIPICAVLGAGAGWLWWRTLDR